MWHYVVKWHLHQKFEAAYETEGWTDVTTNATWHGLRDEDLFMCASAYGLQSLDSFTALRECGDIAARSFVRGKVSFTYLFHNTWNTHINKTHCFPFYVQLKQAATTQTFTQKKPKQHIRSTDPALTSVKSSIDSCKQPLLPGSVSTEENSCSHAGRPIFCRPSLKGWRPLSWRLLPSAALRAIVDALFCIAGFETRSLPEENRKESCQHVLHETETWQPGRRM